ESEQLDTSGSGRRETHEHFDGGGFAGSVGAEESEETAAGDGEREPVDGGFVAVHFAQVAHFDCGRRRSIFGMHELIVRDWPRMDTLRANGFDHWPRMNANKHNLAGWSLRHGPVEWGSGYLMRVTGSGVVPGSGSAASGVVNGMMGLGGELG